MKSHIWLRAGCVSTAAFALSRGRDRRRILAVAWSLLCAFIATACWVRAGVWGESVMEIVELESGVKATPKLVAAWSATRNGCRVARIELDDSALWRLRVDGKPGSSYLNATRFLFSPDGSAYACMVSRRILQDFFVINGVEEPACKELYTFVFSNDGRRHGYLARIKGTLAMMLDGKAEDSPAGWVPCKTPPVFSPDGSKVAWIEAEEARVDGGIPVRGKMRMVVNGRREPAFESCGLQRVFSRQGSKLAYPVFGKGKAFFMVDGKQHQEFAAGSGVAKVSS